MARRPNYRFERAERNRAKEAKKEEKLKRQQERVTARTPDDPAELPADPQEN
ncbi:MAG: hypothetical protein ACREFB_14600 [Stellaceae bacterium]